MHKAPRILEGFPLRFHDESEDRYRSNFIRDKGRIIHASSFRKLAYKTQVFTNSQHIKNFTHDLYRNRLTHSLEVAQISRAIARTLELEEDLVETLSLVHDIGHSPFGHAGESILDDLMQDEGGFDHNCQSLRTVTILETIYPNWTGLNLSCMTLYCMLKVKKSYACDTHLDKLLLQAKEARITYLETLLVDRCDSIAYLHHDIEDGLNMGLITLNQLESNVPSYKELKSIYPGANDNFYFTRHLLRESINDLIELSKENLSNLEKSFLQSFEDSEKMPIVSGPLFQKYYKELQEFSRNEIYEHREVLETSRKGQNLIENLFLALEKKPENLPEKYLDRVDVYGLKRSICDYIAGMTENYIWHQNEISKE